MQIKDRRIAAIIIIFIIMMINDVLLGCQVFGNVTIPILLAFSILMKVIVLIPTLGLVQKHFTLLEISRTDSLTKASTRDVFFDALNTLVHTSGGQRATEPTSIILFDLDDFKQINDELGHHIGDEVLLQVSDTVRTIIRSDDIYSRVGGEEFGILLPRTTLADANKLANRICEAVASTSAKAYNITASFGVGTWSGMETVDHLYARVDTLMYRAKAAGKNTVISE